jgi:hypothetical protein
VLISSTAMHLAAAALVLGLAVAILVPAPVANEDGLLTALLLTVCGAVVLMGALALAGVLTATAVLAATGAAIMVPCAWLARAPEAPSYEWYYEEEEDDDGGGSPPAPRDPSPTPGPEHWRPAPAPVAALVSPPPAAPRTGVFATMRTARTALAPAASATPAPTAAFPATAPPNPRFPYLTAVAWDTADRPAPAVEIAPVVAPAPVVVAPVAPAALPQPVFESPAVRPARGEHPSVEHIVAPQPPVVRRRRYATRLRMLHGWRRRRWFTQSDRSERAVR